MMSDGHMDNDDLVTDSANEFRIEVGLDLLDFCLKHMETAESRN